jgi:hypothetical protein
LAITARAHNPLRDATLLAGSRIGYGMVEAGMIQIALLPANGSSL